MAFYTVDGDDQRLIVWDGSGSKPTTDIEVGTRLVDASTGAREYYAGDAGWIPDPVGGSSGLPSGSDFDADKTVAIVSTREAIPAGSRTITVENLSITSTQAIRFRFGDATVDATVNTGFRLAPEPDTAAVAGDNGANHLEIAVPPGATHWAYISENGIATPTMLVTWG